jgi:hypothetical protein
VCRRDVVAVLVACGYSIVLAGMLGAMVVRTPQVGPLALAREVQPLLFAPAPLVLALGLLTRSRSGVVAAAFPVVLFMMVYGSLFIPRGAPPVTGPRLRVMTFNAGAARGLGAPGPIIDLIRAEGPDVICLVEARGDTLQELGGPLRLEYPYQVGSGSVYALSRFPLDRERRLNAGPGAHDALLTDLVVGDRIATLGVVHLRRIDAFRGLGVGVPGLFGVVARYDPTLRDASAITVIRALREIGGPQILVGDFNATPGSRTHRILTADLDDSFLEIGLGFGHTYPAWLRTLGSNVSAPLLRIDYVFHSPDMEALAGHVGARGDSDHLPVIIDLGFGGASDGR